MLQINNMSQIEPPLSHGRTNLPKSETVLHQSPAYEKGKAVPSAHSACAVVVTFYPGPDLISNLNLLSRQVEHIVIVDNGSSATTLSVVDQARDQFHCTVIHNENNLGIAAALNLGSQWALSQGYSWVALFDQDSTVTEAYIEQMLSEYDAHPQRARVAMIAPRYKDRNTNNISEPLFMAKDGAPLEVMTSGSLISVSVFQTCGWFREDFFIDQVDHEFSFRLRDFGYIVIMCPRAILLHSPGSPRQHTVLRVISFWATHHSVGRRYYMTRNSIVMVQRYWRTYPGWAFYTCRSLLVVIPAKIILVEEQRWKKLKNIACGLVDAIRGNMGRRVGL